MLPVLSGVITGFTHVPNTLPRFCEPGSQSLTVTHARIPIPKYFGFD
jgi:hypothetical protein